MRRMSIDGKSGKCTIAIGESIGHLGKYCGNSGNGVIITDATVHRLYGSRFPNFAVVEIGAGERSKTLNTVEAIYEGFLEHGLDRTSWVIGIGGGLTCDIAGFAASTYLRGLRFGFVPTTLLAQVDASVGGKNGINYRGYKNLIGAFNQPSFVVCDLDLLKSLPDSEVKNGYAEVIKHALIGDASLFSHLENEWEKALVFDKGVIESVVHDSLIVKKGIVSLDETEQGERRKLNFGHTFGHALEKTAGLRHGEAIGIGMVLAARLSEKMGMLTLGDVKRIETVISHFGLPLEAKMDKEMMIDAVRKDKKRAGEKMNFVLLEAIGRAQVLPIRLEHLEKVLNDLCDSR